MKEQGEYQLCPHCQGQGTVSKPPYIPAGVNEWASNQTCYTCRICGGSGLLIKPTYETHEPKEYKIIYY